MSIPNVIRIHFTATFFFQAIVFGFALCSWANLSWILSHQSNVRYGFYLAECALKQIRYWFISTNFVPPFSSISYRQDIIVDLRVCDWAGVYISPLVTCIILSGTKDISAQG